MVKPLIRAATAIGLKKLSLLNTYLKNRVLKMSWIIQVSRPPVMANELTRTSGIKKIPFVIKKEESRMAAKLNKKNTAVCLVFGIMFF